MTAWLRHHRRAFAAALGKLSAQKSAALLNSLVIGIALALPAGGYALLSDLRALVGGPSAGAPLEPSLTVFLRTEAKRPDIDALAQRLKSDARVRDLSQSGAIVVGRIAACDR